MDNKHCINRGFTSVTWYLSTSSSQLPELDGKITTEHIQSSSTLARDDIGTAIINASNQHDAVYLLGFAHAQDRLFQMDLLRRQAAGELSELVGKRALDIDKKHRIHQFRKRANIAFKALSQHQQSILKQYTQGVNDGAARLSAKPFEYYLTSSEFAPWQPVDSLLASYSMYIDLQLHQTERDFSLNAVYQLFGQPMFEFFTLPSKYQAAIDNSRIPVNDVIVPSLENALANASLNDTKLVAESVFNRPSSTHQTVANIVRNSKSINYNTIEELADIGSNNWAVSGNLTTSKSAMLSNDMHLGLRVPAIWYRAQLKLL